MDSIAHVTRVTFAVAEELVVSDPCYLTSDGTGPEYTAPAPGLWSGEIEVSDEGSWGKRVSILRLSRGGLPLPLERAGEVGVDSGRMYAGCLTDLPLDYEKLIGRMTIYNYPECMAFGGGVICSTGYGDGLYPVYADRDFTIVEVRFLEDLDTE